MTLNGKVYFLTLQYGDRSLGVGFDTIKFVILYIFSEQAIDSSLGDRKRIKKSL